MIEATYAMRYESAFGKCPGHGSMPVMPTDQQPAEPSPVPLIHDLGVSTAWVSLSINEAYYGAYDRVELLLAAGPAWAAYVREHLDSPEGGHFLTIADVTRETVRVRARRTRMEVDLAIPVTRLDRAWREGRLAAELGEVIRSIYLTWAERTGLPAPPELPRIAA